MRKLIPPPQPNKRTSLRRVGSNALWTLKLYKIPIIRTQSENQTP
ncbi:hypothetical protein ACOWMZ_00685 [Helicobacter pylori]